MQGLKTFVGHLTDSSHCAAYYYRNCSIYSFNFLDVNMAYVQKKNCSGILQAQSCTKKCSAFYTRMWIFPSGSFCIFALLQALLSVVDNTWCFVIITTTCEILSFRPPFFAYSFPSIFCCCWAFCLLNRLLGYMFPHTHTHLVLAASKSTDCSRCDDKNDIQLVTFQIFL